MTARRGFLILNPSRGRRYFEVTEAGLQRAAELRESEER